MVVLAGDCNSQKARATAAIQTLIVPGLRHERLCFVGMDEMHLPRLKTDKPRDWLICSNYLERLIWKDAFVARDKQHVVVSAIMCPRSSSNPPLPPAHPAASQGGGSPQSTQSLRKQSCSACARGSWHGSEWRMTWLGGRRCLSRRGRSRRASRRRRGPKCGLFCMCVFISVCSMAAAC